MRRVFGDPDTNADRNSDANSNGNADPNTDSDTRTWRTGLFPSRRNCAD